MDVVVVGYCGVCSGNVCVPRLWAGMRPPTPTCEECGRVARDPNKPVLPMRDPPNSGDDHRKAYRDILAKFQRSPDPRKGFA
jgi:hypothetical protein